MRDLEFKMYIILVYDIREDRVIKVLKICRQYLHRIQNSVFEGEITESGLKELKSKLKKVINQDEDSILIFRMRTNDVFKREVIGVEEYPIEYMF